VSQPFVIQLENRPGQLARIARALANRRVNIQHIAGTGSGDTMVAMMTTDDDTVTREVLASMGIPFVEGDTIHVQVEDRPGGIAELTEKLAAAGVNIGGILVVGRSGSRAEVAFTVDDEARAREVLGLPPVHALATNA
jgi:hypothetical protein